MKRWPVGVCVALAGLVAAGCNVVGPASIGSGRAAYGEVLTKSNNEQLLRAIVLDRFSESTVLMAVSSVTANVSITANAGAQFGYGPSSNYERNLVPLSLGFAYEENPTISYVPVDTPSYARQLLSPLSLEQAMLLIRGATDKAMAISMLIERLNRLTNPILSESGSDSSTTGFERAAKLIDKLTKTGATDLVSLGDGGYGMLIRLNELPNQDDLKEFLQLLDLSNLLTPWGTAWPKKETKAAPKKNSGSSDDKSDGGSESDKSKEGGLAAADASDVSVGRRRDLLVIPLRFTASSDGKSIAVMTRSVYDLVRAASIRVDVAPDQVDAGMAPPTQDAGLLGSFIQIQRSASKPAHALVATKVHGNWYYIDERDRSSKEFFRTLSGVWSSQMALAKTGFQAPVLTVGVSK